MWRISTRLIALATVAAILPGSMGSWSLWQHYLDDRRQAAEQVVLLAEALVGEGGRIMGSARQLVDVLATFPSIKDQDRKHCSRILSGVHETVPQFAILAVADASGTVFCSSRDVPANANARNFPWFQRAMTSTDGFAVGGFAVGELTGKPVLQFSRRLTTATGDVAILAALDLRALSLAFADIQLPADARINVIDRAGRILYRHPDAESGIGKQYPDEDLLAAATARQYGIRDSIGLDGVERIVAFLPLSQTHDTGITVTVGRARSVILGPARIALALNVAVLALAVMVATALAWFGAGRPIASSILRLAQVTRAIAGGQSARVGPMAVSEEINNLAASFDQMAERLALRQNDLESALERLETSTDLARIGIFDWDVTNNGVVWNKQHFLLFGFDPAKDTPSFDAFLSRLHPDDTEMVRAALEAARRSGDDYRAEYRIVVPPNDIRWILGVGRYTYDQAGQPTRMRGVLIDVTERRKAEDSLRRIQKMDALGQMTGGIAHDINNILGIISANLQLMEMRPSAENIEEGISTSLAAVNRGTDLVRRLLAFSRRQSDSVCACDVRQEIERVKPLLERSISKGVAIGVFVSDDLWPATMAAAEFGDALLNLAINSAQAMPRGGRLHIEAANALVEEGGLAAGPDLMPGEYVVIAVSDDGVGIPAEIIDKVFEPFFSTKERTQGSGLGLSMVYGFAKRCGGTVRIYSEVDRGTTVRLYLPRAHKHSPAAAEPARIPVAPGGGETVLIVDDEVGFLRIAEVYLRDLGYRTLIAQRPAEALALQGEVGKIDLVFSDVVMPGPMTGIDLANRLSALQPDIKVLLTTGFADSSPSREDNPHAYPMMTKPYRLDELGIRIRTLLDAKQD